MTLTPALHALLAVLGLALAACLGPAQPLPAGDAIPVEVRNERHAAVRVDVQVLEPAGGTPIFEASWNLPAGGHARSDSVQAPYGRYMMRAQAGALVREVDALHDPETTYHRLVVHADVIAYQRA